MSRNYLIPALIFLLSGASLYSQPSYTPGEIAATEQHALVHHSIHAERDTSGYDLTHLRMDLQIDPDTLYVAGTVHATIAAVKEELRQVTFDLEDTLTVTHVVAGADTLAFSHKNHLVRINLDAPLTQGETRQIAITYHGVPVSEGFGTFEQSTHSGAPIIWTLSEPYGARDWFPAKQWLRDKVDSLDVVITHPAEYKAASNGVLVSEETTGAQTVTHWKHRHPIATYLIAVAVTNYTSYTDHLEMPDGSTLDIVNYVYPEDEEEARSKSPNILPVMELFNELFIPYPFADEKYGHAQFGWGGGMEHQTMSFMNNFEHHLMAHEVAHQWFGNYITCGSWREIWLNEGFAVYLTGLTYERMFQGKYWDSWKKSTIDYVTSRPGGSIIVDDTTSVSRIFDGRLTYSKAGYFLHMLRKQIGDEAFFSGLRNYLQDPELINHYAHTDDVRRHLEETADTTLTEFFRDWLYGEGYPLYDLKWSQDENGTLTIEIEQSPSTPEAGFFEMHVQVLAKGAAQDSLLRLYHTHDARQFQVNLDFEVKDIAFNPEKSVLTAGATISHVAEIQQKNPIKLRPNPVSRLLQIEFASRWHPHELRIYTTNGELVLSKDVSSRRNSLELDVNQLSNGSYILNVKTTEGTLHEMFLKL